MTVTIYPGDALQVLKTLEANSAQCCVTSPPYWGLRDYGVPGQLGLEKVPDCLGWATGQPCGECYVCHTVQWAREVRRVLRGDGVLWLVLGDSFASGKGTCYTPGGGDDSLGQERKAAGAHPLDRGNKSTLSRAGLKPKDLVGIPWRVALALQADGWYLRSDVIWAKPNPMPESVTDRPTKAHEYVFLLTKSARYYWDGEAVKEPGQVWTGQAGRWERSGPVSEHVLPGQMAAQHRPNRNGKNAFRGQGSNRDSDTGPALREGRDMSEVGTGATRNLRSVWTIATTPFPGAHFATFPPALAERCIKAATSEKGRCPVCGKPWGRIVQRPDMADRPRRSETAKCRQSDWQGATSAGQQYQEWRNENPDVTVGWRPGCTCGADLLPDDLDLICTPTGERIGDDPSMVTGRAGMNRPRGDNEGQRPTTRYEQRKYAEQLRESPFREQIEAEIGLPFAHYIRTDNSGARPIPADLLEDMIERGTLERVIVPDVKAPAPVPCVVIDPFGGAGTVGLVADRLQRDCILIDLNPDYCQMQVDRIKGDGGFMSDVRIVNS